MCEGLLIWSGRTSELFFQVAARIAVRAARYFVRCAAHDHVAALRASFRTEVDDVVGALDEVEVVFDDDDGVALVSERLEHQEELANVFGVQAGRGFVKDKERVFALSFEGISEVLGELRDAGLRRRTRSESAGRA